MNLLYYPDDLFAASRLLPFTEFAKHIFKETLELTAFPFWMGKRVKPFHAVLFPGGTIHY